MKLFQPSKQIKAKVSFFNDEIIPMDFYTACGVLALAPLIKALNMWRRVRPRSDIAPVYLMNIIKSAEPFRH
ncbi:hypothetical protein B0I72DRAFT_155487 [Yarrowia lipolytica]|uniref:Uncharacterized protein n=1 Tax=Yarrowia lipolytica TaxID=4952 RepID=A0A371BXG1_YARLL|nr:hypothetical protein B0I71DRAFT_177565 [Yarrowia lipolytica]RDW29525.1 hypothetical protein B0I72DRAFT_155487 [Yarrowia lipolytica]RDW36524.1 hypothetical protein B0I73DRAFT_156014 [Yarrowia lipolytica]RDW43282.1 hypothetical protein B0I74DRAFT_154908 [Yarrowia lipolytica]